MSFELPSNYILDTKDFKTIFMNKIGHEKCTFMVVLCFMTDGTYLPSTINF